METSVEQQLEQLRAKNRVRLVTADEEGTGIDRLPNGVYGFTYSPAAENFPLFPKKALRNFEAHKLDNGDALLVGFVTEGESLQMSAGRESITVHLFPDPQEDANVLVSVPMTRVRSHTEHSQRAGKGLEIQIGPVS